MPGIILGAGGSAEESRTLLFAVYCWRDYMTATKEAHQDCKESLHCAKCPKRPEKRQSRALIGHGDSGHSSVLLYAQKILLLTKETNV